MASGPPSSARWASRSSPLPMFLSASIRRIAIRSRSAAAASPSAADSAGFVSGEASGTELAGDAPRSAAIAGEENNTAGAIAAAATMAETRANFTQYTCFAKNYPKTVIGRVKQT
ncbi:hypothetical protein GCM10010341_74130 [Streptomyces noursei]|nr:hypothetical protein GCM10010341_74130 [Streptomyces noursei]